MEKFVTRLTPEEARAHTALIAQQLARTVEAQKAQQQQQQLLKRGPGRPRMVRDAAAVMIAAAATLSQDDAHAMEQPGADVKRRKYKNWFASAYIHDIIAAWERCGHSARTTVAYLQTTFPRLATEPFARFEGLSESTLRTWFGKDQKLLPRYQRIIDEAKQTASRGPGLPRPLQAFPAVEEEIKNVLRAMRSEAGAVVNIPIVRCVMRAVIEARQPSLLLELKLCSSFISYWVRGQMGWSWRCKTGAASKLPDDWHPQGVKMAKRIAANMELYDVHPSLVINMDQTGVNLVPVDSRTYESRGCKDVKVIGAEDKRQITVCIASSLHGDFLPLQLIFTGKTKACLPESSAASIAASAHLTFSENHWSSQETMQQYVNEVIVPFSQQRIAEHGLKPDAHIVLVLDVWSVHKSAEFRKFLRDKHPRIHLVFVPANCTSKLQVADVMLQRPFKHGIKRRFNLWATSKIAEQLAAGMPIKLTDYLKMKQIKPLLLQWCLDSWARIEDGRDMIKFGWHECCVRLYDVHNVEKRKAAVAEVGRGELDARDFVPQGEEPVPTPDAASENDSDDELDVMKARIFGERKSKRKRGQVQRYGGGINPSQLDWRESGDDSEADGM